MLYCFLLIVGGLALFWVITPLLRGAAGAVDAPQDLRQVGATTSLEEERDNLLRSLKELEFDRSMGKVNDDEYEAQRTELNVQVSAVLDSLEGMQQPATVYVAPGVVGGPVAEHALELEVLVARLRRQNNLPQPVLS